MALGGHTAGGLGQLAVAANSGSAAEGVAALSTAEVAVLDLHHT